MDLFWIIVAFAFAAGAVAVARRRRSSNDAPEPSEEQRTAEARAARLQSLLDNINDGVFAVDRDQQPVFVNRRFKRMFGEASGRRRLTDFVQPEDRPRLSELLTICLEQRRSLAGAEYRGRRADGSEFPVECSLTVIESGGLLLGLQAVWRDISHQRLIETSQRALAQRLEFFFSEMPLGCIIWDADFAVQEWNEAAEEIFGWRASEALQAKYPTFLALEEGDAVERAFRELPRGASTRRQQCRNRTKSGKTLECEWFHTSLVNERGELTAVASMVQDVTERRSLERQLNQSQKMEAVGTLAGGVAHDFNNLLTTIIGNISLARMHLGPAHDCEHGLSDAETAADRAAELTQQLLRFSRGTPAETVPVNLTQRLAEVVELVEHSLNGEVELETALDPELWTVSADAGQIGQLLMNLLVNARDAVGERGTVRVSAANRVLSQEYCRGRTWAEPGDWVEISVADDGPGIEKDLRSRIFEPFYTTKPVGKGTGLGLSVVYGIVKNHRGGLEVDSRPGEGAKFSLFLRRCRQDVERPESQPVRPLERGSGVILLADDQQEVRRLASRILRQQGYTVLEAKDGVEAVDIALAKGSAIDLAMMDLTMPRKSGRKALEEMRGARLEFPVILASGYSSGAGEVPGSVFLPKPYTPRQLVQKVQGALESRHAIQD